jgi:hypothetical protein
VCKKYHKIMRVQSDLGQGYKVTLGHIFFVSLNNYF